LASKPHQTRISVANPLRDSEFLELARREAFDLADDSDQQDTMQRLLRQLPSYGCAAITSPAPADEINVISTCPVSALIKH
jgi:hypothetical protein